MNIINNKILTAFKYSDQLYPPLSRRDTMIQISKTLNIDRATVYKAIGDKEMTLSYLIAGSISPCLVYDNSYRTIDNTYVINYQTLEDKNKDRHQVSTFKPLEYSDKDNLDNRIILNINHVSDIMIKDDLIVYYRPLSDLKRKVLVREMKSKDAFMNIHKGLYFIEVE